MNFDLLPTEERDALYAKILRVVERSAQVADDAINLRNASIRLALDTGVSRQVVADTLHVPCWMVDEIVKEPDRRRPS